MLVRGALEVPERRVALVTPDRGLAGRVVAQLRRWDIQADDTAGRPLPQTPAGRVLLLLAEVIAEDVAPVPLIALLTHPLARIDANRPAWLDKARAFDLALRGPRRGVGLAPLRILAGEKRLAAVVALVTGDGPVDDTVRRPGRSPVRSATLSDSCEVVLKCGCFRKACTRVLSCGGPGRRSMAAGK